MELSKTEKRVFQKTLEDARKEVDRYDNEIEDKLKKTRERLMNLEIQRESISQLYSATATLLGIEIETDPDISTEVKKSFLEQIQ